MLVVVRRRCDDDVVMHPHTFTQARTCRASGDDTIRHAVERLGALFADLLLAGVAYGCCGERCGHSNPPKMGSRASQVVCDETYLIT